MWNVCKLQNRKVRVTHLLLFTLSLSHQPSRSTIVQKSWLWTYCSTTATKSQVTQSLIQIYNYHSLAYMLLTQCANHIIRNSSNKQEWDTIRWLRCDMLKPQRRTWSHACFVFLNAIWCQRVRSSSTRHLHFIGMLNKMPLDNTH